MLKIMGKNIYNITLKSFVYLNVWLYDTSYCIFPLQSELCYMVLDCCAQMRTYEKFFGLLAQVIVLHIIL